MKPDYFSICRAIVTHPDHWTIIELRIEKAFITMRRLDKFLYGAILASA